MTVLTMDLATYKQIQFIANLGGESPEGQTKQEASMMIEALLEAKKLAQVAAPELTAGVYEHNDQIYIVKPNKQKTSLYAKKLIEIGGKRLTEAGYVQKIEFVYAPGVVQQILPSEKLPLAKAQELTIRYGRCIACGRNLKDAKSVAQGIGPVCIKYFGPMGVVEAPASQLELTWAA